MENRRSLFSAIPSAIIAGIIVGMIVYFGLNFGGYKEYQAQAKVVTTNIENIEEAANTSATYAATIDSPKIKQRTLENLEIDWNVGKLDSKLEIRPIANTSIIDIIVTDTHKLRAEDIADEYADLTVRVINNIYNSGARVMEYSYGSATNLDNTLRYALISAGLGFLLWALINMIYINSYNKKLQKQYFNSLNSNEVKEVREVSPGKKTTKSKKVSPKETTSYEPASTAGTASSNTATSAPATSKYEILGKIPSYEKGDLDV